MPFANNAGVSIHYTAVGTGPPLVLQHGFTSDLRSWEFYGYLDEFARDFRVICIDARGHGQSDKPHAPESYALDNRAADVLAVLNQEGLERVHYCGYSMGGWIGFGLVLNSPERLVSLAVGGVHRLEDPGWNAFDGVSGRDPEEFIAALESVVGERFPQEARARVLDNDLVALAASVQMRATAPKVLERITMLTSNSTVGHEDVSGQDSRPTAECGAMRCLFYCGDRDVRLAQVQNAAKLATNARLAVISGCNHVTTFTRSKRTLPVLKKFFLENL